MEERIRLWEGEAPYTADSPDQPQPSLTVFPSTRPMHSTPTCVSSRKPSAPEETRYTFS